MIKVTGGHWGWSSSNLTDVFLQKKGEVYINTLGGKTMERYRENIATNKLKREASKEIKPGKTLNLGP